MDALTNPVVLGIVGAVVVLAVVGGVLFVVLKKRDGQDDDRRADANRSARRTGASKRRENDDDDEPVRTPASRVKAGVKNTAEPAKQPERAAKTKAEEPLPAEDEAVLEETEEAAGDEWDWGSTSASSAVVDDTKVSVQDVDPLTEFNVYKQFGYVDKAAESLAAYLKNHPEKANDKNLVDELLDLWLQAKKTDEFSDALTQYQEMFDQAALAEYVKQGLALDANHLGLRVLAESRLGWSVKKTATEIGEQTEETPALPERPQLGLPNKQSEEAAQAAAKAARKELVSGNAPLVGVENEEKGTVLAFMQPEQSMKLLKGMLRYDVSNRYLNKAIRSSTKPAALLIDALTMDYKAKNLRSFIEHLWNLYYSLGNGGRQVKERMLGLGYSMMGEHPIFPLLETHAGDTAILREIGIRNGFIEASAAAKKGRHKSLVTEKVDVDNEPKTPAERVLKEAEFLLMYGQLDQSMDLLESAIREYPQEAQLYITLFDLYERAEEWARLGKLVQDLRTKVQTLPEEVVLAMSQLLQRFNNQGALGR